MEFEIDENGLCIIPEGTTEIRDHAFYGDAEIKKVVFPETLKKIGLFAFCECENLEEVAIPDGVEEIEYWAFANCPKLAKVSIPESVTIKNDSFYETPFLNENSNWQDGSLYIGSSLIKVDENYSGAFKVREGTKCIADPGFSGCKNLTDVFIPESVEHIGLNVFHDCPNLVGMVVDENNKVYDSRNNCNAIIETEYADLVAIGKNAPIPDGVKFLGLVFSGRQDITSIVIPDSVVYIQEEAFENCVNLTEITIGKGVEEIDGFAFFGCESLERINICSLSAWFEMSIEQSAFYECYNAEVYCNGKPVENLIIPDGTEKIERYSFYELFSHLVSVTIPGSVTSIDSGVFSRMKYLRSIEVDESNTVYDSRGNCNAIIETATNKLVTGCNNTVIPESVVKIGDCAFIDCSGLKSVTIPDSITSIGNDAFEGCSGLEVINIPESVSDIGDDVFCGCDNLKSVSVSESNSVYDSRDNSNAIIKTSSNRLIFGLGNVAIPDSVEVIGDGAFRCCNNIKELIIPDSVKRIGNNAFRDCADIENITIGTGVEKIVKSAFRDCSNLSAVDIKDFDAWCRIRFGNADSNPVSIIKCLRINEETVTELVIPEEVESISEYAFKSCTDITTVSIPLGVKSIGKFAFEGCTALKDVYYPGSKKDFSAISIGYYNKEFRNAKIHYETAGSEK